KKPFDDPVVRKAVSMSFNRDQMIQIAFQGTTHAADVTGLSDGFAAWKPADVKSLGSWTTYNPDEANKTLDAAGHTKGSDDTGSRAAAGTVGYYGRSRPAEDPEPAANEGFRRQRPGGPDVAPADL